MTKYYKLSWVGVVLWMAVIFYLSHQPAAVSSNLSSDITEFIINAVEDVFPDTGIDIRDLNHIVRKNAHFIAYFILGILMVNAFKGSVLPRRRSVIWALVFSVLYAMSDEFHQLFIPGRSGEVRDVFIDSTGAFFGIAFFIGFRKIRKWNQKKGSSSII